MQLWNDYEGKTIAETYSLGALLRPEGRSALFALQKGAEAPSIIRLTEALNDESLMIACWRRVAQIKQDNLVGIRQFGQTNFEGTPLTYVVMELTDANLADILKERPLTQPETMQVATSVVAGLSALHAKGFVHEHVDAVNVLAAGETVELRTDCVRECIVDPEHLTAAECQDLIQRDVQDLSTLLLQALTLQKKLTPNIKLPSPFDKIIPNGMNGTWGLREISAVLNPPVVRPVLPEAEPKAREVASRPQPTVPRSESVPVPPQQRELKELDHRYAEHQIDDDLGPAKPNIRLLVAVAFIVLVVIALSLHFFKGKSASTSEAPQPTVAQSTAAQPIPPQSSAPETVPQATGSQAASETASKDAGGNSKPATSEPLSAQPHTESAAISHIQPGWYVIAYTYNHEDQALKKVATIVSRHPSLHPQVISPTGHAPFEITIGGPMSRSDAEAARDSARRDGLPRDTFVRNYKGN